jgi:hypothetical protein
MTGASAHFAMDDGSGTTATDGSGNGQSLTLTNGPTWVAGRVGGGLRLDGVDDHAVRTNPSAALQPTTAVAVSALIKTSATEPGGSEIVSMGDSYALRVMTNGSLRFLIYSAGNWAWVDTTSINLLDGNWHHVLGQYTGSQLQVYVDGTLITQTAATGSISYTLGTGFFVGRHGNGVTDRDFNGTIDQVRVYSFALSAAEVSALAGENVPTDVAAHWKADESSGTTAADVSANAQHLTLVNGPVFAAGKLGNALQLDGVNDHAVRTSPAAALKPTTAVAASVWINTTATDTGGSEVLSMGDTYAVRVNSDGNVRFFIYSAGQWSAIDSTGLNLKDGAWHHIVGQYNGSQLQLYIDGVLRGTVAKFGSLSYTLGTGFYVGKHGNGGTNRDFSGKIDQVRVYGRALTTAEISALSKESPTLP